MECGMNKGVADFATLADDCACAHNEQQQLLPKSRLFLEIPRKNSIFLVASSKNTVFFPPRKTRTCLRT